VKICFKICFFTFSLYRYSMVTPKVHWSLTTGRVLTMEYVRGVKVDDGPGLRAAGIDPAGAAEVGGCSISRRSHALSRPIHAYKLNSVVTHSLKAPCFYQPLEPEM
jgi:hypothetical protein